MISIIIPVYNQQELTKQCISAVRVNTTDCEIIVIDNGSTPPLDEAAIRNSSNLGFPVACNQGIRKATGDIIVLLNNDVIVTPSWSEKLTPWLNEYSIVGPMTNYCAGYQHTTLPAYENIDELNKNAEIFSEEFDGQIQDVTFVIGFCMAFKKSLYDEIGEFDESLWPCSGEEIDFCLRADAEGHKIGIVKDCYVHHFGSQTFNEMAKNGQVNYSETCNRNDEHLAKRWGKGFWQRQIKETV